MAPLGENASAAGTVTFEANKVSSEVNIARDFLNDYSLAFSLHYFCRRNPLGASTFHRIAPHKLDLGEAHRLSPQLMVLAQEMHRHPELMRHSCEGRGFLAAVYQTPDLSDPLLRGLRQLAANASALTAFETGVFYRIRGYNPDFESYVRGVRQRLSAPGLNAPQMASHEVMEVGRHGQARSRNRR